MRATRLDPTHLPAVRGFLERRLEVNLFLLGVLYHQGLTRQDGTVWLGSFDGTGQLTGLVFAAGGAPGGGPLGTAVPEGEPGAVETLGRDLAELGGTHMVVGPRDASDALWKGLGDLPTRVRFDQRLYVLDQRPVGDALAVVPAGLDRVDEIVANAGAMMLEDLGMDPRQVDPVGYRLRIRARVGRGSTLVALERGRIAFQIDVGTSVPQGAQVGGTFVPPAARGRGLATRGMRGVGRLLLREVPRVTLHVNEGNVAAVRCYESAGFRRAEPFRLIAW